MPQQVSKAYNFAEDVAKSDTVTQPGVTLIGRPMDALWIGGAGIVAGAMPDGRVFNYTVVAGTLLEVNFIRVNNSTTTATLMIALWQR